MEHKGNGVGTGAFLLAAGTLIGAGAALLLAPQTGKETRKDLSRYAKKTIRGAEDIFDKGKDLTLETKKELVGVFEEGRKKLERQRTRLEKLIA